MWQILGTLRASDGSVAEAASYLGCSQALVQAAVDYYADFAVEVDAQQEREREFERRERERFERAQQVLG